MKKINFLMYLFCFFAILSSQLNAQTTFTAPPDLCITAGVQAGLSGGLPTGGVYTGSGVTDDGNGLTYSFDPTAGGGATITITYTQGGIPASDDVEVVLPLNPPTLADPGDFCIDSGLQTLGGGDALGQTITNAGYVGPGVTDDGNQTTYTFDPAAAGVGIHNITFVIFNECGGIGSNVISIEVFSNALSFAAPADLCIDAGVQTGLGGGLPVGGQYVGPGVTDDGNGLTYSFDPAAAGVGNIAIVYAINSGPCAGIAIGDFVEVFALPTVTFTALADLCIDAGVQSAIGGGSPTGGIYSGTGVTDNGNGTDYNFDPAAAGVGVHTITYTYTDGNGCTASASDNVEVFALPTVTFTAPADLCLNAGVQAGLGGGLPTGGVYAGTGVTDDGNGMTYSFDPAAAGIGLNTLAYFYTDGNGCLNSASDNVEVFALPIVTFTAPASPYCLFETTNGLGGGSPTGGIYSGPGVTDDGNGTTYSFDSSGLSGDITITYTFTDTNGCTNSDSDDVTVEDTEPPTMNVPANITVNNDTGQCGAVVTWPPGDISADDNCGISSITQTTGTFSGDVFPVGTTTNTYVTLDNAGLSATNSFTVTVIDAETPVISCVADTTVNTDLGVCTYTVQGTEFDATFTDNCPDGSITNDLNGTATIAGEILPKGDTTVVWTVDDGNGQTATCTQVITVEDNEDPIISCVADTTVNTNPGVCTYTVQGTEFDGTFTDNCPDGSITNDLNGTATIAGEILPKGDTTVVWTVDDGNGQTATCTQVITVEDNEDPEIFCVASSPTTVTGNNNTAVDFVDSAIVTTTVPISGIPVGASILDVEIDLAINHTWVGDLAIEIVAPTGDAITILKRPGINFPNPQEIGDCCGNNADLVSSSPITFRDTSSNDPELMGASGIIICQQDGLCDYFPNPDDGGASTSSMALFAQAITASGLDANGNWTINITDGAGGDTGNFTIPELRVTYSGTNLIRETDPGVCTYTVQGTEFDATFTDNCIDGSITNDLNGTATIAGEILPKGDTTVVWTVDDGNGQTATCTTVITVEDNEDPIISCVADTTVNTDPGVCTYTVQGTEFDATFTDNCPDGSITNDLNGTATIAGEILPKGDTTVVWTVDDGNGQTATCTQVITVEDNEDPIISCVADTTVNTDPGVCTYTVQGTEFDGTFTDNCPDGSITNDLNGTATIAGEILPKGDTTVVWTVDDGNGQTATCTQVITVEDNEDPIISCVADTTVNTDPGVCTYTVQGTEFDATFTDNCPDGSITNDLNGTATIAGEILPKGDTTVVWTVDDGNGQTATCTTVITVEDNEDPTWVNPPADLTVECDGAGNTTDFSDWLDNTFTGTDNCPNWVITNDSTGLSDDCGETGTETVTFTLTDESGNFIELDATFTIVDTTDPVWDVAPADLTVECDGAGNVAEFDAWLNATFSGSDTCSGFATVTHNSTGLSDDCGETGTETVTFTLTDDCNNFIELDATFTIVDTTDPVWDVAPADLTVECDGAGNVAEFDAWLNATFSGSDTCSGFATVTHNSTGLSDDCGETGSETVTFTLTDDCGNFIELDATFTIEDTTPAVIGCPGDVTAFTEDGDCGAIVVFQPAVAIEECGDVIVYQTEGLGSGSVFPIGDTLIEFTAQDSCGNLSTCTFTVTVVDDDAPTAVCQNITVQLDDTGNATITANEVNFGSSDNCGVGTLEIDIDTFDCSNVGDNDVTLTVTDVNGNTSTCVAVVTVEDVTAPEVTCQDIIVELGADGTVTIDPMDVDGGSSDACGIATYELNIDTFGCLDVGNSTVILTVTDVNGNQSSCSATVTVEDNTAPELVCMDVTLELNQDGIAYIIPSQLVETINDPCGVLVFTADVDELYCSDIGTPVTVNIFANDGNGNSSFCSSTVTVVDVLGPQIVCPPNEQVNLDPNGTYTLGDYIGDGIATVTDNCTDPVTIFSQDPAAGTTLGFGVQTITFTAEDEYGNVSTCSFELDVQEILGANDSEDFSSLVLYPNPADNQVHLSNPRLMDLNDVTVYDLTGRIVNKVDLTNMGSEISIDVSNLANATYLLVIKGSQGTSTKQLIVNNY